MAVKTCFLDWFPLCDGSETGFLDWFTLYDGSENIGGRLDLDVLFTPFTVNRQNINHVR